MVEQSTVKQFEGTWESLKQFRCPEWFRDAKIGFWSHWGPQSVPGCGDWYARNMYIQGHPNYLHHIRTYGHPSKFGYKDIVAMWKAEKFDPEALIDLYVNNGARYFMGQAVHCDNFDLFDSKHHRWNSVNMGPKRDILGEWANAARGAGLRFGFSEHHAWSYSWFNTNKRADKTGPYAGLPYDGNNPEYQDFYYPPHDDDHAGYPYHPSEEFVQGWKNRLMDAVDKYEPDMLYTDGGVPFGKVGLELVAYFYNRGLERYGKQECIYTYKLNQNRPKDRGRNGESEPGAGVADLEHGVLSDISEDPWQIDTSSGPWYWDTREPYRQPGELVHLLADVVSKNGNLLLNYTQRPDGSLDDETLWIAKEFGNWLRVNGEAIYGTRPWTRYGEGPNAYGGGEFSIMNKIEFSDADFRFTTKGNDFYAITLGWPKAGGTWKITSLKQDKVTAVSMLGVDKPLDFRQHPDGVLEVQPPNKRPCDYAYVLKIDG